MSHEADVERARRAREVLDNPVYAAAYGDVREALHAAWAESKDGEDREHLHRLLLSLEKVNTIMEATMRNGEVAAKELQRKRTLAERVGLHAA
jgi:hypothetical protein